MKIVILVPHLATGGIQRLAVDDANELLRRGHEVWVVAMATESAADSLAPQLRLPADHLVRLPYPRMRDLRAFSSLVRFLRTTRPDILMTHQWFTNTVGRLAALAARLQAHILVFEHSTDDTRKPWRQRLIDRLLQRACTKVVAVSNAVRDSLVRQGIWPANIVVIPNGIDLAPYAALARAPYDGPMRFVFVGRLIADKGVDILLQAFAQLDTPAQLTIAGDGPEGERLRAQAAALGIADRVAFIGATNDVPKVLAAADCLVLPSRREGFGLVCVEAFAAGITVVASDLPGIRSVVTDGKNGILVPAGDPTALAGAMKRLESVALYGVLASGAHVSTGPFSIERHIDNVLNSVI